MAAKVIVIIIVAAILAFLAYGVMNEALDFIERIPSGTQSQVPNHEKEDLEDLRDLEKAIDREFEKIWR